MNELPTTPPRLDPAPDLTAADWFAGLATAGVAGITAWWSAPAAVLLNMVTAPLLSRRRDAFYEELRLNLNDLNRLVAGLTPEALSKNEAFVSALAQATQSAMKTNSKDKEKLEALRNAVLNIALGNSPADDLQAIFLNLVDSFTTVHLQLLRLYLHPNSVDRDRFRRERYVSDQATMDLLSRGLIRDSRPVAARNRDSDESLVINDWPVSNLGKKFLDLVTHPPQLGAKQV